MVMEATLIAPTANGLKQGSPAVTYVNRGTHLLLSVAVS